MQNGWIYDVHGVQNVRICGVPFGGVRRGGMQVDGGLCFVRLFSLWRKNLHAIFAYIVQRCTACLVTIYAAHPIFAYIPQNRIPFLHAEQHDNTSCSGLKFLFTR